MAKTIIIQMTDDEAKAFGLIVCAHCSYPEHNHFDSGVRLCAHDKSCPGFELKAKVGKLIEMQDDNTDWREALKRAVARIKSDLRSIAKDKFPGRAEEVGANWLRNDIELRELEKKLNEYP